MCSVVCHGAIIMALSSSCPKRSRWIVGFNDPFTAGVALTSFVVGSLIAVWYYYMYFVVTNDNTHNDDDADDEDENGSDSATRNKESHQQKDTTTTMPCTTVFPWEPINQPPSDPPLSPSITTANTPSTTDSKINNNTPQEQLHFLAQMTFANGGGIRAPSCPCCI